MENLSQSEVMKDQQRAVLRKYYLETSNLMSAEGILKILSIILCTALSLLYLWRGWRGAGAGAAGGAAALLCACAAPALAEVAPMAGFVVEIVIYTIVGVSLFVLAIISVTLCDMSRDIDFIYGPTTFLTSGIVISSAVMTYMSVSKKWDAESGFVEHRSSQETQNELEV